MKEKFLYSIFIIFILSAIKSYAQNLSLIAEEIQETKLLLQEEFELIENILIPNKDVSFAGKFQIPIKSPTYFDFNTGISSKLIESSNTALALQIPYEHEDGSFVTLDLVKMPDSFNEYVINTSSGQTFYGYDMGGVHYRGIVRGKESSSLAALSVFENEVIGIVSITGKGTINIGKLNKESLHIIYNDASLKSTVAEDFCLATSGEQNPILDDLYSNVQDVSADNLIDNCLKIYFEVDHDIYKHFGNSTSNTINFVTGIFNEVATLFRNESINMEISEIFVWDTPDHYSTDTKTGRDEFVASRPSFNGDLAHLLTFLSKNTDPLKNAGGIANGFGGVCVTGNSKLSPHAHTRLFPDFETFPVFSRQVKVITHEIGHNLGSRHTHACVWNGDNTAIDGCHTSTEGTCPIPGTLPSNTGTIMSYCDRNIGIDFTLGFGSQPGNVIRNFVSSLICLEDCINCPENLNINETFNNGDNENFEASNKINSTANVNSGANIIHDAGKTIILKPGFHSANGSKFHGKIDGCEEAGALKLPEIGFNNMDDLAIISVYPNPVEDIMTIVNHSSTNFNINLYSLTGKLILSKMITENSTEIDISDLPNGVFFLGGNSGDNTFIEKVIIQH